MMNAHKLFLLFSASVLISITTTQADAQTCAGCLDNSFGVGGKTLIVTGGSGQTTQRDSVVQSDGKVVSLVDNRLSQATLIRLNADGTLDSTFAGDGIVETDWHYSSVLPSGFAYGLAIQNVGGEERLVVVGSWNVASGRSSVTMLRVDRYLSNGLRDTSFGTNGSVVVNKPYALAVAIQPADNKIVTVGDLEGVVRFTPDGLLDTTFGPNRDGVTGAGISGWSIKALVDGGILIGGNYSSANSGQMAVTKLKNTGASSLASGRTAGPLRNSSVKDLSPVHSASTSTVPTT